MCVPSAARSSLSAARPYLTVLLPTSSTTVTQDTVSRQLMLDSSFQKGLYCIVLDPLWCTRMLAVFWGCLVQYLAVSSPPLGGDSVNEIGGLL